MKPLTVLVVGCGHMGAVHARAYHGSARFELAGVVARRPGPRDTLSAELRCPAFSDWRDALVRTRPDAVCIATYPDTHAEIGVAALQAGAHVFVEKPLAEDTAAAREIVAAAVEHGRTLVVGYILRHHPAWMKFVELARTMGPPLVMRVSLNQQSSGAHWETHLQLLKSVSPIVDCGVHYVDVMCQMTGARPVHVHAVGATLAADLPEGRHNYGQLQVRFDDGSVGWFECGWGPMMSAEAHFVRDVVGPKGSVSMREQDVPHASARTNAFVLHRADLDAAGDFKVADEILAVPGELSLLDLCRREQEYFGRAIEEQIDLSAHHADALSSLAVVLAADRSIRENRTVDL